MNSNKCNLEFCGTIIKEETIVSLNEKIIPNTAVLEVVDSYPGYYGLSHQDKQPNFIYLLTKDNLRFEKVKRLEKKIKSYCKETFFLSTAAIELYNSSHPAIRIKGLKTYNHLKDIQEFLKDEGVNYIKNRKDLTETAIIKTNKVFWLEEYSKGIYLDKDEKEIGYISLPKRLKWKAFETVTFMVKNNWLGKGFDAALGNFNRRTGIEEVVRIYTLENSPELLKTIQEVYFRFSR